MVENPGIGNIRNLLTFVTSTGKALNLKAGSIIKAQVIDMTDTGEAVLRLVPTGSDKGRSEGTVIRAYPEMPLTKGQNVFLEILAGKNNLTMRLIGEFGKMLDAPQQSAPGKMLNAPQQSAPGKFLDMLAQLSGSRPDNAEVHNLLNMLKSLPQNIKAAIPEFQSLEKLLMDIKQIDGKILQAFIKTSGVAFETRLKIAVLQNPASMLQSLMALQTEGDLKSLLMKLGNLLKKRGIINSLKQAGHNTTKISGLINKFIDNIEFFQLQSKLHDMFYTFLPVMWDDLKDGEFLFKKNRDSDKASYTCDINLDLESLGKLSISVRISDNSFFITFLTERNEVKELIKSQKHLLEGRFESLGLPLKAVHCNYKKNITFGKPPAKGMNLKI